MDSPEEDMFGLSDDDVLPVKEECNPIHEHFMKQLSDVNERIERTKNEIEECDNTKERILKILRRRAVYGDDSSDSDDDCLSDTDLYTANGEPVVAKRKSKGHRGPETLILKGQWQHVFEDKWIIGAILQNISIQTLQDLRFYVAITDVDEVRGISMFWSQSDETLWSKTETVEPSAKKIIATVVLDLPSFDRAGSFEVYGTISYQAAGKNLQTVVPAMKLTTNDVADGFLGFRFSTDPENSILSLKSMCVERTALIELKSDSHRGARLLQFLEDRNFREIETDVYLAKASGSLDHCLAEILPIEGDVANIRIYARSLTQVNIVLRLLRDEFPDARIREEDDNDELRDAAMALVREIQLYLDGASEPEIAFARAKTDLLIP